MGTATKDRKRGTSATGITFNRETLLAAVKGVAGAVPARSPKPILQNVLLHKGQLRGTDLELAISYGMPWTDEPLLLPHARLRSILENATGEEVTLTLDGSACIVRVGRGEWRLPVEDPLEFPAWEPEGMKPIARIPADQFCRAVKSVVYATDNESSRYALGSVLVEMKGGTVTLVATDGRRLSSVEIEVDQATDDSQTLGPERAIRAIAALASHTEGAVQLETNGKEIVASCDDASVTARLVEGRYPRWRDVFPERDAKASLADIATLMMLHGQSSESGESTVTCDLQEFGNPCTVKLDPAFVRDFLANLPADEPHVEIEAVDHTSAVVFKAGDVRGVVMPLAKD